MLLFIQNIQFSHPKTEESWVDSWHGKEIILSSAVSRLSLGPTYPPT
jgi:hypothetical protein